jgi:hypothetical protein
VAVRHSRAVQRLSSATRPTESRLGRIGPISLDVKQMGERSAGNPHAAFDAEGAGNVAGSKCFDPSRRASPRPYLGAPGGESPPGDSTFPAVPARQRRGRLTLISGPPNSSALTWRSVTRRPDDNVLDLLS